MKMLACGSGPLCPTHLRKILGDPVLWLLRKQPYCGSHKFTVQTCVTHAQDESYEVSNDRFASKNAPTADIFSGECHE